MSEPSESSPVRITDYAPWMLPQIAELFAQQYGGTTVEQERLFERFYDHEFQRDRAIRLVALDGDAVVGFQSLFYWPYRRDDRVYRSYQSGRSLVAATHRGRGIFGRLLDHLDRNRESYGCEFLMGFPVEASYGSFVRNGWANPLDLVWHVRLLRPLSVLRPRDVSSLPAAFDDEAEPVEPARRPGLFELAEDRSFIAWRRGFSAGSHHGHFHHREGTELVRFDCKPNRRGRVTELVIGGVRRTSDDPGLLDRAFRALIRALRGQRGITILSIASNAHCESDPLSRVLRRRGFWPIQRRIHFITKSFIEDPAVEDPARWILFRADVDTW